MYNRLSQNEESVWIFAFRYALGRKTTAPWTVSAFLRENIERIDSRMLDQIASDICGHYQLHPLPEDWQMLLDAIQTELSKRDK